MRGKFRLDGRKNRLTSDGHPIIIYMTNKGDSRKELIIDTGYHSKKKDWDKINQVPRTSHTNYANIVNYLSVKKLKLMEILNRANTETISLDEVHNMFSATNQGVFHKDAMQFVRRPNDALKSALVSFNKKYPDYSYKQITPNVARLYMEWLMATPVKGKKRSPNGVHTYMRKMSTAWNRLTDDPDPFKGIRPRLKATAKIYTRL